MFIKPDPFVVLGFTSGKSLEISEEEGLRILRAVQSTNPPLWLEVIDIYGSECHIRTDIICLFALETEETKFHYHEANPD